MRIAQTAQTAQTVDIKTLIDHCKTLHNLVKQNSVKRLNELIDNDINVILQSNVPLSAQDQDVEKLYDCMIDFKDSIEKLQSHRSKERVKRLVQLFTALIQVSKEIHIKRKTELDSHTEHHAPAIDSARYISILNKHKAIENAKQFLLNKQHMTEEDEETLEKHLRNISSPTPVSQQPNGLDKNEHAELFQQYNSACRIDNKLTEFYKSKEHLRPTTLQQHYNKLPIQIKQALKDDFNKLIETLGAQYWSFKNGRFSPLCTHIDSLLTIACKTLACSTLKSEKHSILTMINIALSIKKHAVTLLLRSKKNRNIISHSLLRLESNHRERESQIRLDLDPVKSTITKHLESIEMERQRQLQQRNQQLHDLVHNAINNFGRIIPTMHSHSNIIDVLEKTLEVIKSLDLCIDLLHEGASASDEQIQKLSINFQSIIRPCIQQLQHVISGKTIMTDLDINRFLSVIGAITDKLYSTRITHTSLLLNNEAQALTDKLINFSQHKLNSDLTQQCYNHLDKLKSGITTLGDQLNTINDQANRHIDSLTHRSHNRLFANNGNTLMRTHLVNIKHALKKTSDALSSQQQTLTHVNFTDNFKLVKFINQQNKKAKTNVNDISIVIRSNNHEINPAESKSPIMEFIHQQTNRIINQWNSITRHILSVFSPQNPLFQRVTSAQACQQIKRSTRNSLISSKQSIPILSY